MDVLSVVKTVYSLCRSIEKWIEELVEKELLIQEIFSIVTQIRNILEPFSQSTKPYDGKGELQLSEAIRCVGDVLERTKEHLIVYKYKKSRKIQIASFLRPGVVIQRLKEDQKQLNNQLLILLTSFAVVGYFRSREEEGSDTSTLVVANSLTSAETSKSTIMSSPSDELIDEEARQFWKDYIGGKITFASKELFIDRLEQWYGKCLDLKMAETIIMRLDEYNVGGISPYSLAHGLEDGTLKNFVARYAQREGKQQLPATKAKSSSTADNSLRTPLLVWVDDRTDLITHEVAHALSLGVQVIQLESTAIAKAWVEANMAFLRANDTGSRLRFISDNVRKEYASSSGGGENGRKDILLNYTAGENFLHFLRGRMLQAPVLIYCGRSITRTAFVNSYECAGSTMNPMTCLSFITNLAGGQDDDDAWIGYQGHRGIQVGTIS